MRRGVSGFARFRAGVLPLAAFLVALLVPLFVTQRSDAAQKPGIAAICTQYGSMTASSERFAAEKLTAAHRTLPLGTLVRVTNVHNGHSVVVRINDRGPSNKERIIDVSPAAAKVLQFSGLTLVTLEVVPVQH